MSRERYPPGEMNFNRLTLFPLVAAAALALAGCGPSKDGSGQGSAARPATGRPIEITGNDKMMYSIAEIRATPGEALSVTLVNVGTMPKFSMGHNWVLLLQGTNVIDFVTAGAEAPTTDYIPEKFKDAIVAHTKLLGPNERDTVTFNAPATPGRHVFICSFPGHFQVGMKGVLIVE